MPGPEPMEPAEIAAFLGQQATGVLALAREGDAYAVPEAFGYDGEDLYFKFGYHDGSKKIQYLSRTGRAAFTVYEVTEGSFRSVVATGPVGKVPDERYDHAVAVIEKQHAVNDISVFPGDEETLQFAVYSLDVEELTGRQSP